MKEERAPLAGESLDGYLAYRAEQMGLPNMSEVAELVGLTGRGSVRVSRSDAALSDVADMFEVPAAALDALAHPRTAGRRRRSYMGLSVHVMHLERTRRLFAPLALTQSPHHRALWDLRPFPFDELTRELLGHRCPDPMCRRSQGWHHTRGIERCDECGRPLQGVCGPRVPHRLHGALDAALGLVHPDPIRRAETGNLLPEELRHVDRGDLLDLLVALAGVVDPQLRAQHNPWCLRPGAEPERVVEAVAVAWQLLAGWPHAFERFALDRAMHTKRGRGDGNAGATVRFLRTAGTVAAPAGLSRLVDDERRRLETAGERDGIGAHASATLRGLRAQDISRARKEGRIGVVASMRRGLFVPLLLRSEVEDLSRRFSESVPLLRAGAMLGCGRLGIEQLSAMRLLGSDGPVVPITGHEPRVRAAGLTALVERLEERSVDVGEDRVALTEVFRSIGGKPKAVGPVCRAILDGRLPAHVCTGDGPVLRRISVSPGDVPAIRGMDFDRRRHPDHPFVDVVSKIEAGAELNLRGMHWVELLSIWPTDGKVPVVPVSWLLETAAAGISVAELCKRLGRGSRFVKARLAKIRPRVTMPFLYDRAEVEAVWGRLNELGCP